jgi:hypothetical protein
VLLIWRAGVGSGSGLKDTVEILRDLPNRNSEMIESKEKVSRLKMLICNVS